MHTELYFDEAYYWMYAQFPDWGYFDHPPGVAVMIWLGGFLGKTELAVRLVNILLMTAALTIIYHVVRPKNTLTFCLTLFSFLTFHLSGFVALPDTPFFLFAILFMLAYRAFLKHDDWLSLALLSLTAALMLYCKYHGVLVVLFVLISNPKLLTDYRVYLAGLMGGLLFAPHIWWQVSHDFPSLQYHLVDRGSSYKIGQTLEYMFGNIPYHGGLVSVALLVASFRYRATSLWEKALQWNLYGTLVFFFLITFKGQHIEPNWTIFCLFPLLYLGYRGVEAASWFSTYRKLAWVFAGILLLLKIHLIHPLVDVKKDRVWDFHGSRNLGQKVQEIAGGDLILANDYKTTSLLNFYTDLDYYIPALNLNGRANQYSIWRLDSLVCNRDVVFVNNWLNGIKVEGRGHSIESVTRLGGMTSPNLIQLKKGDIILNENILELSIEVQKPTKNGCKYQGSPSLELTFFSSGTQIGKDTVSLNFATNSGKGERYRFKIPFEKKQNVDEVLVRVLSTRLRGATNQYMTIKADE